MTLKFFFSDNSRGHNDLYLQVAEREWVCDSYYLALDDNLLPEREDSSKVRAVLFRLMEQWLAAIERLSANEVAFLPYDFSDQYTGWLRCEHRDSYVLVSRGWSPVEGWSFSPSAIPSHLAVAPNFKSDGVILSLPKQDLLEAIRASMQQAA